MNILKLEAYFERDNAVYLVTERMETDMCKYITGSANGYLDEQTSRLLIYQVMIALRYLHRNNYAHLDVKCENILLTLLKPIPAPKSPEGIEVTQDFPLVKLADFGYSRIIGEHSFRKTRVGTVGSLSSCSPTDSRFFAAENLQCSRDLSKSTGIQSTGGHVEYWHRSLRGLVRYFAVRGERCAKCCREGSRQGTSLL